MCESKEPISNKAAIRQLNLGNRKSDVAQQIPVGHGGQNRGNHEFLDVNPNFQMSNINQIPQRPLPFIT